MLRARLARLKAETGYVPKVVGITGTNGKTTTTVLTTKMLEAAGLSAKAAGNIGPNAVLELLKAEDAGTLPTRGCSNSRASSSRPRRVFTATRRRSLT